MYIDTHTHLNFPQFDEDRAMVIGNAKKVRVKQCIVPGVDHISSITAVNLASTYPDVILAAVGYHPYEATKNPDVSYLESLIKTEKVVAIGECGLDYHLYKGEMAAGRKDIQQRLFEEQLHLALKYNKPVIIHCRDAFEDVFAILGRLPQVPRGVIHCFSGGLQDIRVAQNLGLYVGIDGNVTYSKHLEAIVPHISTNMLLLETDAPYLTPVPHRGERNEPKYVPLIAKKIAELQKRPLAEVMEVTTANARALFSI
ncbi:MAG TPA: TatD family hydrolase [Patescibacteria group bacterium]|nr:TatD family hydrolase [Patescibacteria group bacterium]